MKIRLAFSALIVVASVGGLSACRSKAKIGEIQKSASNSAASSSGSGKAEVQIRDFEKVTAANGLQYLFISDETLPKVRIQILFKAGGLLDPIGKNGLGMMVASMLKRGTSSLNAVALNDELARYAIDFDVDDSPDYVMLTASCLTQYQDKMFNLIGDIVMNSSFRDEEIKRLKAQLLSSIVKIKDSPDGIAEIESRKIVFGDHPYAQNSFLLLTDLPKVTRADIIKHYFRYYRPNNTMVTLSGFINEESKKKLVDTFSGWKKKSIRSSSRPLSFENYTPKVKLVSKAGLQQAQIRMIKPGIDRRDSRYLTVRVANEALGGGFGAKLNQRVRDELGLTYSIYSRFDARRLPGAISIAFFTKNEATRSAIDETYGVLKKVFEEGITEADLLAAKAQIYGQFPRSLETVGKLGYNLLLLYSYGLSEEYLKTFYREIDKIDVAGVNAIYKELYRPQDFSVLVFADKAAIGDQLKSINGQVTEIEDLK